MLGHTVNAKKSSKFEDSDSRMSRPRYFEQLFFEHFFLRAPIRSKFVLLLSTLISGGDRTHEQLCFRAVSELRPAQRLKPAAAVAGAEAAAGGTSRRAVAGVRSTAPRSPLHEKKPASAGGGAGPRVLELEAKLEKAHGQLMGMRDQLAAAEKARKDARAALVEAKKRLATKKRDDTAASSAPPAEHDDGKVPAPANEAADRAEGANVEKRYYLSSPADGAASEAVAPSSPAGNNDGPVAEEGNKTSDEEEASNNTVVADDDGNKKRVPPAAEVESLRAKLMAKDMEVYELRAKLMVIDTEVDDTKRNVAAKSTELEELKARLMLENELVDKLTADLMVKDAEVAALEADNADLARVAGEAAEEAKAASARVRDAEHALRESAAREARLAERLRESERAREAMDAEALRSRVQSEQWRKAAEEAAAVLAGAGGLSTDKRRHGPVASTGAGENEATALAKDGDEEGPGGKRTKAGGAIRAFSDLWKKKAHK
ncbi:unnamed protein product [Urochloa decumbens]|uniref:Uncharacterized protein n=1 Tax=Urochloa decumbens TaxID=240449 RepID=A0ABC8VP16_9POAL